jgi:lipooligosaccharide transport system permease protein
LTDVSTTARPAPGHGIRRQFDYHWTVYRRTWRGSVISSFLAPLLYVLAMGVLLGGFIDSDPDLLEGASDYLAFVVPGLMAAQAMQTAVGEMTYPVMGGIKWHKSYIAQLATPLTPADVVGAHLMFVLARLITTSAVFCLAVAPFGVFATWWGGLAAFAAQTLVGFACAALAFAFSVRVRDETAFSTFFRVLVFPMFLFAGAFFPIANLGEPLSWVARFTPLWHGVDLTRMLTIDRIDWPLAGLHVLVLIALSAAGWRLAVTGLAKRLVV